jgi:hypothetical protein
MFANFFSKLLEPFTDSKANLNELVDITYGPGQTPDSTMKTGKLVGLDGVINDPTATLLDVKGNTVTSQLDNRWKFPIDLNATELINERQAACEGASGDAFSQLSKLEANSEGRQRFRCGWVYNDKNPDSGRGAYGSSSGPIKSRATGTWMWNLSDAKKKYHTYICNQLTSCDDLENPKFKGRCGFCTSSKKGIPIIGSSVAYPYDGRLSCSSSNLVTGVTNCPRPPPPPPPGTPAAAQYMKTMDTCDQLPGGRISRDCYILKARQAGCSDDGTLINALKSSSDTNYFDTLKQVSAYNIYQNRASLSLNEAFMKTGKQSASDALRDFQYLKDNAASAANLGLKEAASDLCFTAGTFEQYDFCTELQDSSNSDAVSIECIQKEFKRSGGQETGTMYPSPLNIMTWKSNTNWSEMKKYIQTLVSNSRSSDRRIQQDAIDKLYGMKLSRPRAALGNVKNVEVFWFTADPDVKNGSTTFNTTFLGRRIRSNIPNLSGDTTLQGNSASRGSFIYFTNVIPPSNMNLNLRFTGDSGFILLKNKIMTNTYSGNGADSTNREFSSLYPSFGNPQSSMTTGAPWTFDTNGPNIITGYYLGNGVNYRMQVMVPAGPAAAPGSPCFCFGRTENGIRLYTKSECDSLGGNFAGNGECLKAGGGSWSWECRNVNNSTCIPSSFKGWTDIPSEMLNLIQHPFAPMIKFAARPNYTNYGCDYAFCDKRLGSHKMKFVVYGGNGPTLNVVPDSSAVQPATYNLDNSYMRFMNGSGINSLFYIKLYSFMTMVIKIRFTTLPSYGITTKPIVLWPSYPSIDFPSICLTGTENNAARLGVGSLQNNSTSQGGSTAYGVVPPGMTTNGPIIRTNQVYYITLKAIRGRENDVSTLTSLQVGAGLVSDLQVNPSSLKESSPLTWPNKLHLEDPDSKLSRFFLIRGDQSTTFDLFSIELYDYILNGENLQYAANMEWPVSSTNVYS